MDRMSGAGSSLGGPGLAEWGGDGSCSEKKRQCVAPRKFQREQNRPAIGMIIAKYGWYETPKPVLCWAESKASKRQCWQGQQRREKVSHGHSSTDMGEHEGSSFKKTNHEDSKSKQGAHTQGTGMLLRDPGAQIFGIHRKWRKQT